MEQDSFEQGRPNIGQDRQGEGKGAQIPSQSLLASPIAYAVITIIAIRLRYDYDPITTYRARLLPIRRKQR